MKLEVRSSGGRECESCGATALVVTGGREIAADLAPILEREIVRREIAVTRMLLRVFEEHAEATAAEYAENVADVARQFTDVQNRTVASLTTTLDAAKERPSRWHPFRRRRERLFAERIDGALAAWVPVASVEVQ